MFYRPALCAMLIVVGFFGLALGRDVSFFAASDLHYGIDQSGNNEQPNKNVIAIMNNLPGAAFPNPAFGNVATPRGVLVPGDLTDSGTSSNYNGYLWLDGFVDDYPVQGGTGAHLHFPVYEGYGNHDVDNQTGDVVLKGIVSRNASRSTPVNPSGNGYQYSWTWDDVHFINLGIYAGGAGDARDSLSFLQADLAARANKTTPIVIMQHYGFDNFSTNGSWWSQAERDAFYNVIKGYKVVAMFSGHEHWSEKIIWNGIPDFVVPCAKGGNGTDGIYAVRMLNTQMIVSQRRLDGSWANVWTTALPAPVPEPGTLVLLGTAGVLWLFLGRRRARRSPAK